MAVFICRTEMMKWPHFLTTPFKRKRALSSRFQGLDPPFSHCISSPVHVLILEFCKIFFFAISSICCLPSPPPPCLSSTKKGSYAAVSFPLAQLPRRVSEWHVPTPGSAQASLGWRGSVSHGREMAGRVVQSLRTGHRKPKCRLEVEMWVGVAARTRVALGHGPWGVGRGRPGRR